MDDEQSRYSDTVSPAQVAVGDDIWNAAQGKGLIVAAISSGPVQVGIMGPDGAIQPAGQHVEVAYNFDDAAGAQRISASAGTPVRRRPRS